MNLFLPDLSVTSFQALNPAKLKCRGIRLLFCDVDNTLSCLEDRGHSRQAARFLENLRACGIEPVLFTNNTRAHLHKVFGDHPQWASCTFCCKPLPFAMWRELRARNLAPSQAAILGDQLFTDILAGSLAGVTTILSGRLGAQDRAETRVMRLAENVVLSHLEKKGKLKRENNHVRLL